MVGFVLEISTDTEYEILSSFCMEERTPTKEDLPVVDVEEFERLSAAGLQARVPDVRTLFIILFYCGPCYLMKLLSTVPDLEQVII